MDIVSIPPGCKRAGDFRKFSVRGGLGKFWSAGGATPLGGAPKSRGGGMKILMNLVRMYGTQ